LLPIGIAALSAFLVGWVGAILCMDQTYFVGPIARLVGDYGADVSFECLRQKKKQ
jgi:purine-cytosine permease-like protein